ncbi:AOC03_06830 family ribosome hibernation factor [Paenimyroides aestuarii]|uniref:Uncharacterized protein n=1 Tax=Paenimyroides aestuarii TaxID=2968490 RepID=A0ABY5NVL6_9FLAO|nr:hypothetical protein [Paenimyroides aestuarii]UUV22631.1 hypothetical protein NPX36_06190 [Paenimyroides aestuarii]
MKNYKPMETKLKQLRNVHAENCVTILLNTHRTFPENEQDPLVLKNLIKEAERKLLEIAPKKQVDELVDRIHDLANSVDHRQNLESLILFVNHQTAEFIRLPIDVEDRVAVGNRFAMRDLIRNIHHQVNYYVLVLSKEDARLIEASNDKVVKEWDAPFPFENVLLQTSNNAEPSDAGKIDNLIAEFFNQVDKAVNDVQKENALPVLISTDEPNYHEYLKIADKPQIIVPKVLVRSRASESAHAIVEDAWELMEQYVSEQNEKRKADLQKAVSSNRFISDTNEIYRAIKEGRVQTLYIEKNLFQPALIVDDQITYISNDTQENTNVVDDLYDELIDLNSSFGGDVVFLPKESLTEFNGFAALTRY